MTDRPEDYEPISAHAMVGDIPPDVRAVIESRYVVLRSRFFPADTDYVLIEREMWDRINPLRPGPPRLDD